MLQEAIDILYKSGSIEYAEKMAKDLLTSAWQELEPSLPESEGKIKLDELSKYLIDRDL
jgi:geranylgeranyl pyrophosphate synthase